MYQSYLNDTELMGKLVAEESERYDRWDITPEHEFTNEACANIYWGGASEYAQAETSKYQRSANRDDVHYLPNGLKVYVAHSAKGSLVRYWLNDSANVTVRVRVIGYEVTNIFALRVALPIWRVELYTNRKQTFPTGAYRWHGTHRAYRDVATKSEACIVMLKMIDHYAVAVSEQVSATVSA